MARMVSTVFLMGRRMARMRGECPAGVCNEIWRWYEWRRNSGEAGSHIKRRQSSRKKKATIANAVRLRGWPPEKCSTSAVAADGQVGLALEAALRQIGRDRLAARHADDGAAGAVGDDIVGDQRGGRAR